ncbi:dynein alpha chain, flagellar outer arm [Dorcoceras hygrometricum]|uniref:Dynein alpha chain, flagellar outer arm n=1 Tax=Dorcoceras hygrometricum TaxID=472368 RepID=A0A2Z7A9Y2_9LAMI|nr:dynein alpha chain, flagellar outer arm [Dorcoceras hygrometricum]
MKRRIKAEAEKDVHKDIKTISRWSTQLLEQSNVSMHSNVNTSTAGQKKTKVYKERTQGQNHVGTLQNIFQREERLFNGKKFEQKLYIQEVLSKTIMLDATLAELALETSSSLNRNIKSLGVFCDLVVLCWTSSSVPSLYQLSCPLLDQLGRPLNVLAWIFSTVPARASPHYSNFGHPLLDQLGRPLTVLTWTTPQSALLSAFNQSAISALFQLDARLL